MYLLLVRHKDYTETLEYEHWESLVRDAADYEAGEYRGTVVGAVELTIRNGRLINTITRADLWDSIWTELRFNPQWRAMQANLERWSDRRD